MDTGAHASVSHANSQVGIPKLESSVSINPLGTSGVQQPYALVADGFADIQWKHIEGGVQVWVDADDDGQFSEPDLLFDLQGISSLSAIDFVDNFPVIRLTVLADSKLFGSAASFIYALAGNDTVDGGGGNDTVYGGEGDDDLRGGDGADVLAGDDGSDTLHGGTGNDYLLAGTDTPETSNQLFGELGNDTLQGGAGLDLLDGGADNDNLSGEGGADVLLGGSGSDTLSGGDGNDALTGGNNDDFLSGDGGVDTLSGVLSVGCELVST